MKKLFIAMAIAMFGASQAQAGFMIEPYLGYETGSSTSSGSADEDYTGTLFGARLGYSMMGFMFGADYMTASGTIEQTGGDLDLKTTDLGAFVGYEFPIMFRIYLSYMFDSKATPDGVGYDFEGSATRFGIGYTGLPFVAINLEMIKRTYDETSTGLSISPEQNLETYALTISLPLP
ncbi:MAG: outer membrane beta-barrel protein [Bdellovibrionales bacterium]|nr:outer membrane beta-barrel protein [Bdellovibrionales bacterium]